MNQKPTAVDQTDADTEEGTVIDLSSITRTPADIPPKIAVFGAGGIGKTTFAAGFPDPVIVPTETGTIGIGEISSFPLLTTYTQVMDALKALHGEHDRKTLIIDSISQLESLIWEHVCQREKWNSIESPGFGKGYVEALVHWREFMAEVNSLRDRRRMLPILIAHEDVKMVNDPTTDTYDRFQMRLHRRAEQEIREEVDILGFMTQKLIVATDKKGTSKRRALGHGERTMKLSPLPSWTAKCRYRGVPAEIDIPIEGGFEALATAIPSLSRFGGQAT